MDVRIEPRPLAGYVPAIASKSMAHRMLICAALCPGTTDIDCNTDSQDIAATVRCLEALGARIARTRLGFRVIPIPGTSATDNLREATENAILDCGESGSTLRFLLPVCAALGSGATLTGRGRLAQRPLSPLYEQLSAHGVTLSENGRLPLSVSGKLRAGRFDIAGNVSSQFVSGLLLAAPLLDSPTEVVVKEPIESHSYIRLTIEALKAFGVTVDVTHGIAGASRVTSFLVSPAGGFRSPGTVAVEGDWSNAAFWFASGAIAGEVGVTGLNNASVQGDRACLACLAALGARASRTPERDGVFHDKLVGRAIDISDIPDLAAPLAAVAAFATGTTTLANAGRLRLKESDRLSSITSALTAMGVDARVERDSIVIAGGMPKGGVVDAAGDHRIAMMAAIVAAHATGPTTIRGAECVAKSYPAFFEDFRALGGIAKEA